MSSEQIHLTPEEIDRFAHVLEQFASQLYESTQTLNGNLEQLGDSWRDPAFTEFEDQFLQARNYIENFVRTTDEHVAFLKRKAQATADARDLR